MSPNVSLFAGCSNFETRLALSAFIARLFAHHCLRAVIFTGQETRRFREPNGPNALQLDPYRDATGTSKATVEMPWRGEAKIQAW